VYMKHPWVKRFWTQLDPGRHTCFQDSLRTFSLVSVSWFYSQEDCLQVEAKMVKRHSKLTFYCLSHASG
jgi:hypothetical protein